MTSESAKLKHHHHHHSDLELPNPHAHQGPEETFENLLMMLEAQFGSNIAPIERPRIPSGIRANRTTKADPSVSAAVKTKSVAAGETPAESQEDESTEEIEAAELARLQALGIPYPGIEIKVDKHVARYGSKISRSSVQTPCSGIESAWSLNGPWRLSRACGGKGIRQPEPQMERKATRRWLFQRVMRLRQGPKYVFPNL